MLLTLVVLLAAAVLLVSLSRRFGFGSILGYLLGGVLVGPSGLRLITDVETISDISGLGVLMLLFIIGLAVSDPLFIGVGVLGLLAGKAVIAFGLGRWR